MAEIEGRTAYDYRDEAVLPAVREFLKEKMPEGSEVMGSTVTPYDVLVIITIPHKLERHRG